MEPFSIARFFAFDDERIADLFQSLSYPWEALPRIHNFISKLIATLDRRQFDEVAKDVYCHRTVDLAETAVLNGPAVIMEDVVIRPGAYIRGNVYVGRRSVVGNSTEIKNSVLIDHVQAPHYNYIGDSILGTDSHLGAGVILSNLKSDQSIVVVRHGDRAIDTHLRKFGAIIGDGADVGCNSVLAPGALLGKRCRIYPLSFVRGEVSEDSIYKHAGEIVAISCDH